MGNNKSKKDKEVIITFAKKACYFPDKKKEEIEVLSVGEVEKKLLKDPRNWSNSFRQENLEAAGYKILDSFYARLIEDYGNSLKVEPLLNQDAVKYFLISKDKIKNIKPYFSKN